MWPNGGRARGPEPVLGLIVLLQTLIVAVSGPATSPEYLPIRVAEAEGYFAVEGLAVTVRTTRAESGAAQALAQAPRDLAATAPPGPSGEPPRRWLRLRPTWLRRHSRRSCASASGRQARRLGSSSGSPRRR